MHGRRIQGFLWALPLFAASILGGSQAFAQDAEKCDSQVCYIQITGSGFLPSDMTVNAGSTVIWKNMDEKVHAINIYSLGGSLLSNSTLLRTGDVFQFTFDGSALGRHEYADAAVINMKGRIQVEPLSQNQETRIKVDFANPGAGIKSVFLSKGAVKGVELVPERHRIEITVDAQGADNLRIKFDRRLFDAKSASGIDAPFQVAADGKIVQYKEVFATPAERLVSIPIPAGAKTISMTGSRTSTELLGYDEASAALNDATATMSAYREQGLVMSEADGLLLQAKEAFGEGKYPFVKDLAREATNVANTASSSASAASKAMNEAEASINTTKTFGIDVSDAEAILMHTKEKYASGGYDEALNMAVQAKVAASSRSQQLMLLGVVGGSSAVAVYLYLTRRNGGHREQALQNPAVPHDESLKQRTDPVLDLGRVFAEKPHLRQDDRQVLGYVMEKGGEALLADIRNSFGLPKSTAWRLVKRLEREELVEIIKFGNQNLVKCSKTKDADELE